MPATKRVAEGVLLVEEAGVGAGLDVEPGAPLVDDQADAPARVVAVHDRGVAGDELVHPLGVHHRLVVVVSVEVRLRCLSRQGGP